MIRLGVVLIAFAAASLLGGSALPTRAADSYLPSTITLAQLFARRDRAYGSYGAGAFHEIRQTTTKHGDVWTLDTSWVTGGDSCTTERQGDFVESFGTFHKQRWSEDENGFVRLTSGYAREANPYVNALTRAQGPDSGVKLLGLTSDSGAYVVQVAPRPGLTEWLYYDAHTYLLTRADETDYDGHHQVWEYHDYQRMAGLMVPGTTDYSRDGTAPGSESKVVRFEKIDPAFVHCDVPVSKPLFDLQGRDVSIPATFTMHGIVVRVSIAGRGLDFELDSGSPSIFLDSRVASELGITTSGAFETSFAGDIREGSAHAPDFSVGELQAQRVAIQVGNFEEQLDGRRIVGLLGADFIASGALEVNFEKQTLTLHPTVPPNLAAQGWSVLPLRLDYSVPLLKASFSGRPGYFIADLGADESMLFPHYFSEFHVDVPRGTPDQGEMMTLGHVPFGVKHFTMSRLFLGDWVFGDVQVSVPSTASAQEMNYDGLIGRDTLSNFDLIFDYNNRQLWFKPINGDAK
jgi:hypothetical protein